MPAQSSADAAAAAPSQAGGPSAAASPQVGGARPQAPAAPLRIAFLGPFGTFTEQAVRQVASPDAVLLPMTSAPPGARGSAQRAGRPGRGAH